MENYQNTPDEHDILKKLLATNPQEGDIVFRGSNAKGPYGMPFMKLVQQATKSDLTHAGLIHFIADELFIVEETDIGTVLWRFEDWLGFCLGEKFAAYRLKYPFVRDGMKWQIDNILQLDPDYDYTFNSPTNFYCTRLAAWIYMQAGWPLCTPKTVKQIVNNRFSYSLIVAGNWLYSKLTGGAVALPLNVPLYFVGNETNGGILASPYLEKYFGNNI